MKIKKLLTGIVAGAIALSTVSAMSLTSTAEDAGEIRTFVLWEGEKEVKGKDLKEGPEVVISNIEGLNLSYFQDDAVIEVTYTKAENTKENKEYNAVAQVGFKVGDDYKWTPVVWSRPLECPENETYVEDPEDEYKEYLWETEWRPGDAVLNSTAKKLSAGETATYKISLNTRYFHPDQEANEDETPITYSTSDLISGQKGVLQSLITKGKNMIFKKITITGTYVEPVLNEYIDNGDGSYTYNYSGPDASSAVIEANNANTTMYLSLPDGVSGEDVQAIKFTVTANNWVTFSLGASEPTDGNPWIQSEDCKITTTELNAPTSFVLQTPNGILDGSAMIKCTWLNFNTSYTISNIEFIIDESALRYTFNVEANPAEGGAVSFNTGVVELSPDGTKLVDVSALDENWVSEQKGALVKRIIKGGEQDNAVWTDDTGNEALKSVKSITITVSGVDGTKLHTTGSIVYSPNGTWNQALWKINVSGDNDDGISITQVGNDYNITFTPNDPMITDEDLAVEDSNLVIAIQNYGDSHDKSTPDMVVKGISLNDADGNVVWSDGTVVSEVKYPAGTVFTCKATPSAGYKFVSWTTASGALLSIDSTFEYTLGNDDTVITANFEKAEESSSNTDDASSTADDEPSSDDSKTDDTSKTDSNSNGGSTTSTNGGSTSTKSSSGSTSSTGSDSSANTGASALAFVGVALAGAAIVLTKKKK